MPWQTGSIFSVGYTTVSGRWFLEILGKAVRLFFGSPNFSLPLTGGLCTIFLSGICSCILVRWMGLRKKRSWILVSGILISFPVLAGLFFYNFTAPYYLFALVLVFLGSELLCKKRGPLSFLGSVILVALGTSVYQAFIPLYLSLLLTYFIRDVRARPQWSWGDLIKEVLWYCAATLGMIALYLLSVKISTAFLHETLLTYKGISSMGTTTLADYLNRVKYAYYLFLFPTRCHRNAFVLYYGLLNCHYIALALIAVLGGIILLGTLRKNPLQALSIGLAFAVFPLASNFIYVICDGEDVYTLMQFGQMAPFLLLACLCDWLQKEGTVCKISRQVAAVLLALCCLFCLRTDNAIYTKAELAKQRTLSYFTTMVTQIKSVPGYTSATPVAYVGDPDIYSDPSFHGISGFGSLSMTPLPYDFTPFCVICTAYDWQEFLDIWCGFSAPSADSRDFEALPEVTAMPCYPSSGSIQMVDGTVVVKICALP